MRRAARYRCLALAVAISCQAAWAEVAPASPPQARAMPLAVMVNGTTGGTWVLVERAGVLYAPAEAFDEWRLPVAPDAPSLQFKGQRYVALTAIPGFKSKLDVASQTVELTFSPKAFTTLRMSQDIEQRPPVSAVLPSLFLNYDLSYQHSIVRDQAGSRDLGVLAEAGVSTQWGVLTSSGSVRNLAGYRLAQEPRQWLRLETTLTRDFPDHNTTLRVGDTTTKPGMWGREVYFGGVRFGSNFALTPGFVSQPLPVLTGLSAAPSTVELYVNDVLRSVSKVPTGPFVVDNFPVVSGNGEARLVVRDLLGRETVITQPFFITNTMLAKGLDDWSVEAGRVRVNLGLESNHYGPSFASGTWRHGVNDNLTLEGRAEVSRRLKLLGAGMLSMLPGQVLARAALVGSRTENLGDGGHWLVGLEHEGLYGGASIEYRRSSHAFRETGEVDTLSPIRTQLAATWTFATNSWGTFGAGYADIERMDFSRVKTVSVNYSHHVFERGTLTLSASRALAGGTGSAVGLSVIVPLDPSRILGFTANARDGSNDAYASIVKNPGIDSNLGWRALAGMEQDRARGEAGVYYQNQYAALSSDLSVGSDMQSVRLGAIGGLVYTSRNLWVTRRVDESFALVEVPGYPNVGVGLGSNVFARTNADGVALIPRLIPYVRNSVRIDPKELPINAEIESIEQAAVPSYRSGVKVTFPVRGGRGALLKIVLDDGAPAPAGAVVSLEGDQETFYVARRGEAYVTGLLPESHVRLEWKAHRCALDVRLPAPKADEIPRVGPIACHGVAR